MKLDFQLKQKSYPRCYEAQSAEGLKFTMQELTVESSNQLVYLVQWTETDGTLRTSKLLRDAEDAERHVNYIAYGMESDYEVAAAEADTGD